LAPARAWTFWRLLGPRRFGVTRAWTFWRFGPGRFGATTFPGRSDVASLTLLVGFCSSLEKKLFRKRAKTATGNQVSGKQMSGPGLSEAEVAVPF